MATSNAQRQAAYRRRQLGSEVSLGAQLNFVVDRRTKMALKRISVYYGYTQKAMLSLLINAQDGHCEKEVLKRHPKEFDAYWHGRLKQGASGST